MNRGMRAQLKEISAKLSDILKNDSDEQVMIFTDDKVLMELCGQINLLLLDRQKMKADFRKQEIASKKMLANISHDIKTPLTVILGYLEIMRLRNSQSANPAPSGAESDLCVQGSYGDETLEKVEAKAKQVMELIDQFFTLAKLEAGDKKIEMAKININELCRENVLGFYELLIQKDFEVEISIPEQAVFVLGDREAIGRILSNLLSNAIRYGSDGKYIGFFLREENDEVCIDVVDRGKGIERQFAASVFERLFTMEDSRNRSIQGNGLGLTIAKNLANQMGGDILLESEPGVRTVFTVKLKRY
ncbi:MAG: sensor histidine kinase [Lachnospiraceae bacterium]|nr:sensor histidine kinase [Lachnospiraceae bacterium]